VETVDLNRGLSVEQLDALIGARDHLGFLNPKNELYRRLEMKRNPPERDGALRLMSENPNLIRRPLVVRGGRVWFGFNAEEWEELA
jgi:arsenate reductase-like glutaredoxin family protein